MARANPVPVNMIDLDSAFQFVGSGAPYEHSAFISIDTGKIYLKSDLTGPDPDTPEDIDESDRYIAIPHKNSLDLGRALVFSFVERELPEDYEKVAGFFRRRGAYARFKDLLEDRGMIQKWYDCEASETDKALREWCEENGFQPVDE